MNANGESVVGVVYDPYNDRMYEATRGGGARLNDTVIRTSDRDTLTNT